MKVKANLLVAMGSQTAEGTNKRRQLAWHRHHIGQVAT